MDEKPKIFEIPHGPPATSDDFSACTYCMPTGILWQEVSRDNGVAKIFIVNRHHSKKLSVMKEGGKFWLKKGRVTQFVNKHLEVSRNTCEISVHVTNTLNYHQLHKLSKW